VVFGAVVFGAVVFGAVVFGAVVFGAVVFGAVVFGAVVFGAVVFGAVVFGAVVFGGVAGGSHLLLSLFRVSPYLHFFTHLPSGVSRSLPVLHFANGHCPLIGLLPLAQFFMNFAVNRFLGS
jgi:hypothetical protein